MTVTIDPRPILAVLHHAEIAKLGVATTIEVSTWKDVYLQDVNDMSGDEIARYGYSPSWMECDATDSWDEHYQVATFVVIVEKFTGDPYYDSIWHLVTGTVTEEVVGPYYDDAVIRHTVAVTEVVTEKPNRPYQLSYDESDD